MTNLFADSCKIIGVIADLEQRGCRVLRAQVLPSPEIHITPPPPGAIGTYAFRPLPRGTWAGPTECTSFVRNVKVTWWSGGSPI